MNIEDLRTYCLALPYVEERFPFDDTTLVFCIGGHMFALVDLERADRVNLKCKPDVAVELRERYEGVVPGWHMNKKTLEHSLFASRCAYNRIARND